MIKQTESSHIFWSGFSVGAVVGAILLYLFGTKKGKEHLERLLTNADILNEDIEVILDFLKKTDSNIDKSLGKEE